MRSRLLSLLPLLTVVAACGTTTAINDAVGKVQAEPPVEVGSVAVGVDTTLLARGAEALAARFTHNATTTTDNNKSVY